MFLETHEISSRMHQKSPGVMWKHLYQGDLQERGRKQSSPGPNPQDGSAAGQCESSYLSEEKLRRYYSEGSHFESSLLTRSSAGKLGQCSWAPEMLGHHFHLNWTLGRSRMPRAILTESSIRLVPVSSNTQDMAADIISCCLLI